MTRHSKNNTTAGSFTHAERQKLSYGSQSSRCTKDSLRPFTHCHLCLEVARDPNSCPMGHVACRSCFLEDILSQKNNNKLKKSNHEREISELNNKKIALEDVKKLKNFNQFLSQQGTGKGIKRSFDQVISNNNSLIIPDKINNSIHPHPPPKEEICCRAGIKGSHPLSLKTLIPIKFSEPESNKPGCPSCLKLFNSSNALKGRLFKKCGHVVCEACYKNLNINDRIKCFLCEGDTDSNVDDDDIIVLESEGTGFAAGGGLVETKRYDLAFQ